MPQQTINIGAAPDDGTGDTIRVGGDKINDNFTELYTDKLDKAGGTLTGDLIVPDEAYDATAWNGSLEVPTKNALRDKIETLASGTPTELDDLTDVNAPTPSNGDVLTWDSTPGEWVSLAPSGGIAELDDIPDVNAPTPSNGDVLTWDSTPGEWVAAAPTGGGSGIAVEEDGVSEGTGITSLNFTTGLDVSVTGSEATISASGGGGGYGFDRTPTALDIADWSWLNQGTASGANGASSSGIVMTVPSAATNVRMLYKTSLGLPAPPYRICARLMPLQTRCHGGLFKLGLMVMDTGNNRIFVWSTYGTSKQLTITRHTATNAIESTGYSVTHEMIDQCPYRGVHDDGTTLSFQISPDGKNWTTITTRTKTDLTDTGTGLSRAGFGVITASPGFEDVLICQDFWVDDL